MVRMKLKELRKSKGLTQDEAAEICGLSRRGYQNLEMGSYKKTDS
ncbi:MAG: helix-turn-helix transcriptional regulator, partial [Bacilli bacterium]|nr:helix-turn-helix transcriptional regulator [Bacilli bacterium]